MSFKGGLDLQKSLGPELFRIRFIQIPCCSMRFQAPRGDLLRGTHQKPGKGRQRRLRLLGRGSGPLVDPKEAERIENLRHRLLHSGLSMR